MRTSGAAFEPQLRSKLPRIGVGHMLVQLDKATEPEDRQRYAAQGVRARGGCGGVRCHHNERRSDVPAAPVGISSMRLRT